MSFITLKQGVDDAQVGGRLTWIADVKTLQGDEVEAAAERYYRYFPQSRDFHRVHDFDFYRLELVRVRYIGGFGKIYWISPDKILQPSPFSTDQEQDMIDHMNHDHVSAMKKYCVEAGIETGEHEIQMVGIDSEGFHLRVGEKIIRFNFIKPANTAEEIRARLVAMAH